MAFEPSYMRTFVGGNFSLDHPRSVRELRATLAAMDAELKKWGDDKEITYFWIDRDKQEIQVIIKEHVDFSEMER